MYAIISNDESLVMPNDTLILPGNIETASIDEGIVVALIDVSVENVDEVRRFLTRSSFTLHEGSDDPNVLEEWHRSEKT